jgi:hypothetical protein
MQMPLFETAAAIESSDSFHMGRLLLLIDTFTGAELQGSVQGVTKLAKLDFFLRYPGNLERALSAKDLSPTLANVKRYERNNVESTMVWFKYGPWDFRYRRFLNLLVSRGLIHLHVSGRTVHISATARGHSVALELASSDDFTDLKSRTHLLKTHFDIGGTTLMKFIYATFPELSNLRYGASIGEI